MSAMEIEKFLNPKTGTTNHVAQIGQKLWNQSVDCLPYVHANVLAPLYYQP